MTTKNNENHLCDHTEMPAKMLVIAMANDRGALLTHRELPSGDMYVLTFQALDDCLAAIDEATKEGTNGLTWYTIDPLEIDPSRGTGIKHKWACINAPQIFHF